jgi:nicotinamide-nucleotide amidase
VLTQYSVQKVVNLMQATNLDIAATTEQAVALAHRIGALLSARGMLCATAESCTGGLVGHLITEVAGSSAYFAGGAVVYSYAAKVRVLGVGQSTLEHDGAVSYAVARQMAQGALRLYGVGVAIAITGIAGPGGGLPDKPVGTVHVHLSAADGYERGERYHWTSDRSGNKLHSAVAALQILHDYLND